MMTRAKCVRFEIEYEDGRVVRAASPEAAERHHRDLDSACGIAHAHGWAPVAPPEFETVRASRSSSGSGEREAGFREGVEAAARWLVEEDAVRKPGIPAEAARVMRLLSERCASRMRRALSSAPPSPDSGDSETP